MSMNPIMRPGTFQPGQPSPNADGSPVPVGYGPAPYRPSQPEGEPARRRIVLPGADFPPADARAVDLIEAADIAAGATATILSFRVPDTYTFRVAGIGFGAEDESGLRFLSWSLIADPPGTALPGYVNQPAAIGSIAQVSWIFTNVGSSVTVSIAATNNATASASWISTFHYIARLQGWLYKEAVS
jgi:hypothetical protein